MNIFGVEVPLWLIGTIIVWLVIGLIAARPLLSRLIISLLTKRIVCIVLGTSLLVGGLIFGMISHIVPYQQLPNGTLSLLSPHVNEPDNGNVYIQDISHPGIFYIIHEADFSPSVKSLFLNTVSFTSLIYSSDSPQDIPSNYGLTSAEGTDAGKGYTVVRFALTNYNGLSKELTSATYRENPAGCYEDNWTVGGQIAGVGLIVLVLTLGWSLLMRRQTKKTSAYGVMGGMQAPYMPYPMPGNGVPLGYPPAERPQGRYANSYARRPAGTQQSPYADSHQRIINRQWEREEHSGWLG